MPAASSSGPTFSAYWVASTSVGAIIAACAPVSAARASAWAATSVLPVPTSPSSMRFIGRGAAMSARISAIARCLVGGELEREGRAQRGERGAVDAVRDAGVLAGERVAAHRHAELQQQQLVVGEPRACGRVASASRRGKWIVAQRRVQRDEPAVDAQRRGQVVGHVGEVVDRRRDEPAEPVRSTAPRSCGGPGGRGPPSASSCSARELLDERALDLLEAVVELDLARRTRRGRPPRTAAGSTAG